MASNFESTDFNRYDDQELARQLIEEQKAKEEADRIAAEEINRKAREEADRLKQTTTQAPASRNEELARKKDFAALLEEKLYNVGGNASQPDEGDLAEAKRLGISNERLMSFVDKISQNKAAGEDPTYYKPTALGAAPIEEPAYATRAQTEKFWGKVDKNVQAQAGNAGRTGGEQRTGREEIVSPVGILSGLDELAAMQKRPFGQSTALSQAPRAIGPESAKWMRAARWVESQGGNANALKQKAGELRAGESGVVTEDQGKRQELQKREAAYWLQKKQESDRQQLLNNLEMARRNKEAIASGKPIPYQIQ